MLNPINYTESNFLIYQINELEPVWYDKNTALLLSLVDEFYEDIKEETRALNLSSVDLHRLSEMENNDSLFMWFIYGYDESIVGSESVELNQAANRIIQKYKLGPRWLLSIKLFIVKDYLILPLDAPVSLKLGENVIVETNLSADGKILKTNKIVGDRHLTITFNISERISKRQLTDLINAHEGIGELLKELPESKKSRLKPDSNSSHWGYLVWAAKTFKYPNHSWQELVDELITLNPEADVPDRLELQKDYKNFINSVDHFKHTA